MASGNSLQVWGPAANQPPSSNFAVTDTRNGTLVLVFDDTIINAAIFPGFLPRNYSGGGLKAMVIWAAATATTGDVRWRGSFERLADGVDTIASDSFGSTQTITTTTAGTAGIVKYSTIIFTDGAQIDSLLLGEAFRFKLERFASDAADTMAGNAQAIRVELRET